ncbi:MAG TPA: phosphoribosylglycinamide formyltransferase [Alphaproteobacteria bacterium]|nr:phosphoribosylglycinamide formyltransferase [Alphaproteobacteria bacterium]USO04892.1 MAG: phosphoribosylglycinamide formyltransferase [Rhodospirillales bacterium]HOO82908.1 phosphoribosylglycinamide formyltransferase [Alphaproteobacteria bacterium]
MSADKLNLAVFISGNGSNLQALIDACKDPDFPARIALVVSNRPGAYGLERAKKAEIPAITIDHKNYTSRSEFENALQDTLKDYPVDLICLAGFMRILSAGFVNRWTNKIINTHPALLPKFGGKGMYGEHVHRAVLDAGEPQSGCSIHYVIPEVDQGPVIVQKAVPVQAGDSVETLAARVIAQEHIAYPEAVRMIAEKQL